MATETGIKLLEDWRNDLPVSLEDVLTVSMDVMRRTGDEACRHAIILMAQSARAMTRKAPARRTVQRDMRLHGAQYVEVYGNAGAGPTRLYKFSFGDIARKAGKGLDGTWDKAQRIASHGLAKRSWMWGLARIGGPSSSRSPIPGTSRLLSIRQENVSGYIKENNLGYIQKAMPAGWEAMVQERAGNKIMQQSVMIVERTWQRSVREQFAA